MQPDGTPCTCGSRFFDEGGFGLNFCLDCGKGRVSGFQKTDQFISQVPLVGHQSYTRVKRFKKYLCRAMRQQSSSTVPRATWDYLLQKRPFTDTNHIQKCLKQARHLKRKCYDSLPFLTAALCPDISVPRLTLAEKKWAIDLFYRIDRSIRVGPFVSYLFCLEYILVHMGRVDMLPFINKIKCPKRRLAYTRRLDGIFDRKQNKGILESLSVPHSVHARKSLQL